jgi:hypothetical protein
MYAASCRVQAAFHLLSKPMTSAPFQMLRFQATPTKNNVGTLDNICIHDMTLQLPRLVIIRA